MFSMKSHYEPSHRMSHCINRTQLFIHHSLTNLTSNSSFSLNCSSSHSRIHLHLHRIFIFIFFFFFIFAFSVHTPFLSLTILLTNPLTIPLAKHRKTHLITPLATPTHPTIKTPPTTYNPPTKSFTASVPSLPFPTRGPLASTLPFTPSVP